MTRHTVFSYPQDSKRFGSVFNVSHESTIYADIPVPSTILPIGGLLNHFPILGIPWQFSVPALIVCHYSFIVEDLIAKTDIQDHAHPFLGVGFGSVRKHGNICSWEIMSEMDLYAFLQMGSSF